MRKALYCYFGLMSDSSLNTPHHPLYQLFFIKSLANKFDIDKFDILYYDQSFFKTEIKRYHILREEREYIHYQFVDEDDINYEDLLEDSYKYDEVFLKYRFRNYSRLSSGSYDRRKFEMIYNMFEGKCWVIDTDAEIKDYCRRVISLFAGDYPYSREVKEVVKIIPVLKEDIKECSRYFLDIKDKKNITYIGNQYFKVGIKELFEYILDCVDLTINVQGKWSLIHEKVNIIDRTNRVLGYKKLSEAICSLQISKLIYDKYDFMSPRIFESLLLGTIIFSKNSFMSGYTRIKGNIDIIEKIKHLQEIDTNEYKRIFDLELDMLYDKLEKQING